MKQRFRRLVSFWAVMVMLGFFSPVSHAQQESPPVAVLPDKPVLNLSPEENNLFRDAAKELRCPTCQGMSILESDAAFSVQMKNAVKEKIKQGMSKQDILQFFTERYGPWILRQPPKTGFSTIAWAFPIGLMLLGPLGVWFFVWRKRKSIPTQGVRMTSDILAEMQQQLQVMRQKGG